MALPCTPTAITTYNVQLALMNAGSGSAWAGAKVHLAQTNVAITPTTPLASLVEATFDGYAAVSAGAPSQSFIGPDGLVYVEWEEVLFVMTGSTTTNIIYSYYLTNTASTVLLGGNALPAPVNMTAPNQGLPIEPSISYGS
jgi:hypothetical protein